MYKERSWTSICEGMLPKYLITTKQWRFLQSDPPNSGGGVLGEFQLTTSPKVPRKARWTEKKWSSDRPGLGEKNWGNHWKRQLDVTPQHGFTRSFFFQVDLSKVRSQSQYGILVNLRNLQPTWKEDHLGSRMGQVDQSGDGRWCYLECCCGGRKGYGRESCVPKIYDIWLIYVAVHHACGLVSLLESSKIKWIMRLEYNIIFEMKRIEQTYLMNRQDFLSAISCGLESQVAQDRLMNKLGLTHCKVVETAHPYENLSINSHDTERISMFDNQKWLVIIV